MNLQKKVVIITGASSGIGKAAAAAFVKEGANVVLVSRDRSMLLLLASQLIPKLTHVVPTDVTQAEQVQRMIDETILHFGKIDILVNNAGAGLYTPIEKLQSDDVRRIFELNVIAPITLTQAVIPHMRNVGEGKIINVSSMITRIVTPFSSAYRASKLALNGISDGSRFELAKDNIKVVTVFPGRTSTDFYQNCIGAKPSTLESQQRGRSPEFVAKKIIDAAKKNKREVYMGLRGYLGGKCIQLFPGLFESMLHFRSKKV